MAGVLAPPQVANMHTQSPDDPRLDRHILALSSVAVALYAIAMGLVFLLAG